MTVNSILSQTNNIIITALSNVDSVEISAVYSFMSQQKSYTVNELNFSKTKDLGQLNECHICWIHSIDTCAELLSAKNGDLLKEFVNNGGNLILTLEAARLIFELGLEPLPLSVRRKNSKDQGYGRKLGLHAFRSHPVFDGLNGGAYIFKPMNDTSLRTIGFFDQDLPTNGKVIAVDWDYIFLRENTKLMYEYTIGKGKILVIGAYTYFSLPNINRQHLEKFILNCFNYLLEKKSSVKSRYWSYNTQTVKQAKINLTFEYSLNTPPISHEEKEMTLVRDKAEDQYWDVANERMVIMGKEPGGIDEIWTHPYMAFRDYKVGLHFSESDSIVWLNNQKPEIFVRPTSFTRIFEDETFWLKETISTSPKKPEGIIQYEFFSDQTAEFIVTLKSNKRLMWPYSEFVYNQLLYNYEDEQNLFTITNEEKESVCYLKSSISPITYELGQFDKFEIKFNKGQKIEINTSATEEFMVKGVFVFPIPIGEHFAFNIGMDDNNFELDKKSTNTTDHFALTQGLQIKTPNTTFNQAYQWALASTESFYVYTPDVGKSIVAGYGTTAKGWDGEHTINGRPGYAWYFGRDGQWSGFAMIDYGDFEKVKNILLTYIKLQDLNGKIYHEVSTSGAVHYDASDATPLFIILAGKYLKHSGDSEFISDHWVSIKKAIDYCYSTDTDNDLLIENTNVGHGWVEGGGLFGSHSSLYLVSCWANALENAAYMATAIGKTGEAKKYDSDSQQITNLLSTNFWNDKEEYFYHGLKTDGSYITENSIMSTIPIYFEQIDPKKSNLAISPYSGNDYSSDWGCRMLGKNSKLYNPISYHGGSVWPLFTGWVSLAEYAAGRSIQGFTHLMNNAEIYDDWSLGKLEEVLNGETYTPQGVNAHQCWSETMILQPAIEGMLGLKVNALKNRLELSPQFPSNWDTVYVENIWIGKNTVDMTMFRSNNKVVYTFTTVSNDQITLDFKPNFEKGSIISALFNKNNKSNFMTDGAIETTLQNNLKLEYQIKNGVSVLPILPDPLPGDKSTSIKILNEILDGNRYSLEMEAIPNQRDELEVFIRDQEIDFIINGKLLGQEGNIYKIKPTFAGDINEYIKQTVIIHLKD